MSPLLNGHKALRREAKHYDILHDLGEATRGGTSRNHEIWCLSILDRSYPYEAQLRLLYGFVSFAVTPRATLYAYCSCERQVDGVARPLPSAEVVQRPVSEDRA